MAIRHCDGNDPNLTRTIREDRLTDEDTISPWNHTARPNTAIINCRCQLIFDDVNRMTIYPHHFFGQHELFDPFGVT